MLLLFGLTRFDCISLKLHNWFQDILNLINAVDREAENTSVHWKIFVLFFKRNLISDLKHWFDLLSVIPETLFSTNQSMKILEIVFLFVLFLLQGNWSFKDESSAMQLHEELFAWASSSLWYDSTACWKSVLLMVRRGKVIPTYCFSEQSAFFL